MKYIIISAVIFGHIDTDKFNAFRQTPSQLIHCAKDYKRKQQTEYNLLKYITHHRNLARSLVRFFFVIWLFHSFRVIKYSFIVQCCCCSYIFFGSLKIYVSYFGCPLLFFLCCTLLMFYLFWSVKKLFI